MNRLIEFFAKQGTFSTLLAIFVVVAGAYAAIEIRREAFPNIQFDVVTVNTIYAGASPEEVEKLITNPIEQEMKEVDGIKKLKSVSAEGRSYITAQLDPDQTTAEKGKADIQDVVDRVTDLPEDAEEPIVTSVESKLTPIIEVSVSGKMDELELRKIAKRLEYEVESLSDVARVVFSGLRDLEIKVEADPRKLARYRISLDDLVRALKQQNKSVPGGHIKASTGSKDGIERTVRTIGEFETVEDIEQTVIRANDLAQAVRVKDVAKVSYGLAETEVLAKTNGEHAISLTVLKKEKADAIRLVDELKAMMAKVRPTLGNAVNIHFVNDSSYYIRRRLKVLSNNLGIGLLLVLIVLTLILRFRVALITSIGIPFSFFGAMFLFNAWDVSLNLITMMGMIIVTGMLVDDAIVVTDNAVRLIEEGEEPEKAAIKGTQQIWSPVTASVMTTVMAFLPMAMMSGIFGKFVKYIPIGVIVALLISLFECFLILPHHIGRWINPATLRSRASKSKIKAKLAKVGEFWDNTVVPSYVAILHKILKRRYWVSVGALFLFVGTMVIAKTGMRFVLFPPKGIEVFFVRADAPVGTGLEKTAKLIEPIEQEIGKLSKVELDYFTTRVGIQQKNPNDPNSKRGSEYAQITVYLTPEPDRDRSAGEIVDDLRSKIPKPEGLVTMSFERVNPGPPVGKPVNIGVRGETYEEILPVVEKIKKELGKIDGVSDIADTYTPGKDELQISVNSAEAAAASLDVTTIGTTVRAAFEGLVATTIRRLDEEIDVRVSLPLDARSQESTIGSVNVPNQFGNLIPLSRVATFKKAKSLAAYQHENNRREVRVTGEINTGKSSAGEVASTISDKFPALKKEHPGISFSIGGENEDTAESLASLGRAFVVAVFGILLILVMTFKNLSQPLLVLSVPIPMGVISVVWIFFLHRMPLSFMGMLGIVALAGVIVNNAIVFVDFINEHRKQGMDRYQSIIEAGRKRIRPIFLTTVTTAFGVLPTAYGIGGLDQFVVPIAMALGWGLFIGSLLIAFLFPAAVGVLDDIMEFFGKLFSKNKNLEIPDQTNRPAEQVNG